STPSTTPKSPTTTPKSTPSTTPKSTPTPTTTPKSTPSTTPKSPTTTPKSTPSTTPKSTPTPTTTPKSTPSTTPKSTPTPTTTPKSPTTTPKSTPSTTPKSTPTPTTTPKSTPSATPTTTPKSTPSPTQTTTPTTTPSTTPKSTPSTTPSTTSPTRSPVPTPSSTPITTPKATPVVTPSQSPTTTPSTPSPTPNSTPKPSPGSTPSPTTSQASPRPTTAPVSQTPQPTRAITTPPPLVTTPPAQTLSVFVNDLINKRTTTPAPTTTTTVENLLIIPSSPSPPPLPTQSDGLLAPITEQPQTVVPRPNSTQRNDNTPDSQGDTTATAISVSGAETSKTQTTRYIFSALVGVTLVLLVFFHYVAINPSSIAPETVTEVFTSPNSWQLPTFISFVQCVSLGSFLNVNAPHAVFVAFTDSFSWMNLIVRSSPSSDLNTTTASSLVAALSQGSTANRQLAGANSTSTAIKYDAFGFEQFALRGNLRERDLFARAWLFFLIACASIVAIAIVAKLVARMLKKNSQYDSTQFTATSHDTSFAQQFSDRVVSFVVLFVAAVILPLSLVSTYELMQDINSANGFGSLSGIFALISLIVLVSLVIGATVAVSKSSKIQLNKYDMKVTFGFLYVNLKYDRRLFCAVTLLVQLLTGVFLAVLPSSQCLLLLILHGVYLLLIIGLRPFQSLFMFCMVILFEMCLLALFGIEYAMVHSDLNAIESKRALAIGVIGIVCVVVLLVFAHCIIMLWTFVMGTAFIERWKVPFSRRDGKTLELATEQEMLDIMRHVPLETQREGHYLTSMQVVTVSDQERLDLARRVPLDSQRNSRSSMQVVTGNMYS
ncbi:unnamed protein product, partial [Aphanomyces euteiches]